MANIAQMVNVIAPESGPFTTDLTMAFPAHSLTILRIAVNR